MSIVSAIVLFAVFWFLALFIVLPIGLSTQGDEGARLIGTHAGSPSSSFSMRKKLRQATMVAVPAWILVVLFVLYSGVGVRDIDIFGRMEPSSVATE